MIIAADYLVVVGEIFDFAGQGLAWFLDTKKGNVFWIAEIYQVTFIFEFVRLDLIREPQRPALWFEKSLLKDGFFDNRIVPELCTYESLLVQNRLHLRNPQVFQKSLLLLSKFPFSIIIFYVTFWRVSFTHVLCI